jgi:hypothetical protein
MSAPTAASRPATAARARRDLLSHFQYFGVPDEADYRNIPRRNSRFDEDELTRHVATQPRARNAYEQLQNTGRS